MKKVIALSIVGVLLLSLGAFAFADSTDLAPQWFKDMVSWKRARVQEAVEEGTITEEQAQSWNQHFEDMEAYHNENGFQFPANNDNGGPRGGFGPRGSFGPREDRGPRAGFGPGSGGCYRYNQQ